MHVCVYAGQPNNPLLKVSNNCKPNATVSWRLDGTDPVCGPVSYNVTISPSDGVMATRITDTSYHFTGLNTGITYSVAVNGANMAGVGAYTTIPVRTAGKFIYTFTVTVTS